MRRRGRIVLIGATVLIIAAVGGVAWYLNIGPLPGREYCRAEVAGHSVELDLEQTENAALIATVAVRRGLPPRAASIAITTAIQESKLRNIEHGDRDSIGLFQQRPSQGWGRPEQILNPVYAVNAFYDALQKIGDYESMAVGDAAQEVQRSAYPDAYADHEADGRTLASALTGEAPEAFSCVLRGDYPDARDRLNDRGLTRRADVARRDLVAVFGELSLGGFEPGGARSGHMRGSAHYDGRAVDVFVRPVSEENRRRGWAIAHYLVAQADRLQIQHVIFDDRIWTSGRSSDSGWSDYRVPVGTDGDRAILEHRDHVHVDVAE